MSRTEPPVLVSTDGRVGRLVLNRPQALNALNREMVDRLSEALDAWERDAGIAAVVLSGAGERGLCAGGDIRGIHEDVRRGGGAESARFWAAEYRLNARIARYPKPYVALMDGVVMGGGVGVSAHGGVRVVTERAKVAMPETGIGFVPDVGGTWLLSRAPGELGTHLALTAGAVGAADAVLCGLADHFVPADRLADFAAALADAPPAAALARYAAPPPAGELAGHRAWIDDCYSAETVTEILRRLRDHGGTAAKEAAAAIETKSPTSLKVTLAALRRARGLSSLEEALNQEYRTSVATLSSPDFAEGVRAQLIDKDRRPHWSPATLDAVSEAEVARHFAAPESGDLGLGVRT
ncbi:enoyl-CoA hydratase/isomerase family protein [Streptomyces sp. 891-h]|uniref:enoyl-CoA hydratase/isomerase family protein n=1 Tax=Streptomyces sp. 891-h TaxID=2720714 RepID=UPI001FAB2063|nr:enoyl-CoA hydratase/isomerase family protein [Streptomyces sp. 891-h]UNZ16336.1 enoyl-CoA hydratase/isomerase family protein [Streptomyces sp. 891-h]